jgi:hypothetical protein
MRGAVNGHRQVDALIPAVIAWQLEPAADVFQRERVGKVAVDLVRGGEDERRVGTMVRVAPAGSAFQARDGEVGLPGGGPVVRRLGGGVDDELDLRPWRAKTLTLAVADVECQRFEVLAIAGHQAFGGGSVAALG